MDFAQVGASKTTTFDGFVHPEIGPVDIVVSGITAAHEDYEALRVKYNPPFESQSIYLTDDNEKRIEVPYDPAAEERMTKLLAAMVTSIEGLDGWKYSPEATLELFQRSDCRWIVKQWKEHLDSEGKSSRKPARRPARGQKS